MRDDNEIVAEIYNTKQEKNENVRSYNRRLKELLNKMENQPADGLKKRWFTKGLIPLMCKNMKVVPSSSYVDAYNRAINIESEKKKPSREKKKIDDDESTKGSSDECNRHPRMPKNHTNCC